MTRISLACSFLAFCVTGVLVAQNTPSPMHPNFSGRWKMDKEKSRFGGFPMPDMIVRVVDHHDPTLNLHTVQTVAGKTSSADVSYFTDGSPVSNVINGRGATSKAFWDGPNLEVRTEMKDAKGDPVTIEDRWELADDQQTLITTSHITTGQGTADLELVCHKEPQ